MNLDLEMTRYGFASTGIRWYSSHPIPWSHMNVEVVRRLRKAQHYGLPQDAPGGALYAVKTVSGLGVK